MSSVNNLGQMNSHCALITGATSGIGYELAVCMARDGIALVLVGRNSEKLAKVSASMRKEYGVTVHEIVADLAEVGATEKVYKEVKKKKVQISYLVNNAGFGEYGLFVETLWEREHAMINLNITTLTHLTKLFLPEMIAAGSGKVLNIASTAAFQPGPRMAVYYATKSYVLHFSEAVQNELSGSGVTVTALCPGPTASGFQSASHIEDSRLIKGQNLPSAAEVAVYGYRAMQEGKSVAVHGWKNRILAWAVRFLPRNVVTELAGSAQKRVE